MWKEKSPKFLTSPWPASPSDSLSSLTLSIVAPSVLFSCSTFLVSKSSYLTREPPVTKPFLVSLKPCDISVLNDLKSAAIPEMDRRTHSDSRTHSCPTPANFNISWAAMPPRGPNGVILPASAPSPKTAPSVSPCTRDIPADNAPIPTGPPNPPIAPVNPSALGIIPEIAPLRPPIAPAAPAAPVAPAPAAPVALPIAPPLEKRPVIADIMLPPPAPPPAPAFPENKEVSCCWAMSDIDFAHIPFIEFAKSLKPSLVVFWPLRTDSKKSPALFETSPHNFISCSFRSFNSLSCSICFMPSSLTPLFFKS